MQGAAAELVEIEALPTFQRASRYRQGSLFDGPDAARPPELDSLGWVFLAWLIQAKKAPAKAAAELLTLYRSIPRGVSMFGDVFDAEDLEKRLVDLLPSSGFAALDGEKNKKALIKLLERGGA